MSTVHSTADWDETTCGLSLWSEIEGGDRVLDESVDPATAIGSAPCSVCYPPEEAAQRAAFYAAADAKRIPWSRTQETIAAMLSAKADGGK